MYIFRDFQTKAEVKSDSLVFTGEGRPWEVVMDLDAVRQKINLDYFRKSPPFVSKYLPFLPVRDYYSFISMGEGETPLIRSKILEKELSAQVFFKLEGQNPTGSFKDRGSAVELSVAKEFGAKGIVLASTGNMAASCACYAAAARIPCYVIVPEGTPQSKLAQVIAYGGRIVQVKGTYGDAARLAEEIAREYGFYLAGDYAFRVEGGKTAAFELIEQFHYQIPDMVVVPIGCGTNIASYYKGFREYYALGLIPKIPRLIGVQAEAANPVVRAFKAGKSVHEPLGEVRSLARAIAINDPLDGIKALDAIYQTSGFAIDLTEEEMVASQYELSKDEGIFVETSCAACFAALKKISGGSSLAGKSVVCILTGTGLKDPDPLIRSSLSPASITPTIDEFRILLEKELKATPRLHFLADLEFAFSEKVTKEEVRKFIEDRLNIFLEDASLDKVHAAISEHLSKGISVLTSDLKYIIEEVIEEEDLLCPAFSVQSYAISSRSSRAVECRITVRYNNEENPDEVVSYSSKGIGLVDAIFNSFLNIIPDKIVCFQDFVIQVRKNTPQGFVSVHIVIEAAGKKVSARASSVDVTAAAVKAVERAFNKIMCP
jgi:threonine synthase